MYNRPYYTHYSFINSIFVLIVDHIEELHYSEAERKVQDTRNTGQSNFLVFKLNNKKN